MKFRLCNTMTNEAMLSGWKEETLPVNFNTSYIPPDILGHEIMAAVA